MKMMMMMMMMMIKMKMMVRRRRKRRRRRRKRRRRRMVSMMMMMMVLMMRMMMMMMITHFVRACAIETRVKISQEPLYAEIYSKNAAPQNEPRTRTLILCEPGQSKRMSRFHKSHFLRKCSGKMPRPRMGPERGHTFCASLRNRNACQDFTRATLP